MTIEEFVEAAVERAVRRVLREELGQAREADEYLDVATAARRAAVTPQTIRAWARQGRLSECRAGRELRVKRSELDALLEAPSAEGGPEEAAKRYLTSLRSR